MMVAGREGDRGGGVVVVVVTGRTEDRDRPYPSVSGLC